MSFATYVCVIALLAAPLAPAQSWGVTNTQRLLTVNNATTVPTAALSPAGEVYTVSNGGNQTNSIAKLDSTGKTLYTVTLAGTYDAGIVFDSAANLYVTGTAAASGFTTTSGAYRSTAPGDQAAYVCKLSPANGAVQYCTYLDAIGDGLAAVDGSGSVAVAFGPNATGFFTSGAIHLGSNIHVEKLNSTGTALVYAANFGGSRSDYPQGAVADAAGSLYITGKTYSPDFPTTPNAAVASNPSGSTSFTVRLNASGSALLYSTLGNPGEQGLAIAIHPSGGAQVMEEDASGNLFLRRYKGDGSGILFETSLGVPYSPSVGEIPRMAIDSAGVTTVAGVTNSITFPAYGAVQTCQFTTSESTNGFLIRADASGDIVESTYLQGPGPAVFTVLTVSPSSALELIWSSTNPAQGQDELDLLALAPVTAAAPVNLSCIGNAASLTGAPLAPGEIVSLFGSGLGPTAPATAQFGSNRRFPTSVSNTQVTFDGIPAPLLYVSSTQINAVTPFGLTPNATTQVCVTYQGTRTNCMTAGVAAAAPGIFTNPATGYAAALNQDGTVNSRHNPAPSGSIISLFATGLGQVTPPPVDGSLVQFPLPTQNLRVRIPSTNPGRIFGEYLQIQYAGPAPLEIAGLSQINVQVPVDYPSGAYSVWVTLPDGTVAGSNRVYIQ